jgi:cell shape-determining protein MreC
MLGLVMVMLLAFVPSYGQSESPVSNQIIKGCEQAVDELRVRRVEVEGLKQQIVLLQERDKLRDQYEANQAEQIVFWKTAATERKEALGIDDRVEKIRLEQITDYKSEVERLRAENERLRRSRDRRSMVFGALGVITGSLIHFP